MLTEKTIYTGTLDRRKGILREMEEQGLVAFLDNANMGGRSLSVRAIPVRNLGEVWELVEASTVQKPASQCGPKEVNARHAADIKNAFNKLVEKHFDVASRPIDPEWYQRINDRSLFVFDREQCQWSAIRRYAAPALARLGSNSQYTLIGALERALELAVSHGRLKKPDPEAALELPATEGWLAFDEAWAGPFAPRGLKGKRTPAARLLLFTCVEVVGQDCEDPVSAVRQDTDAIAELLDAYLRSDAHKASTGTTVRKIVKRAHEAGLLAPSDEDALLEVGLQHQVELVVSDAWGQEIGDVHSPRGKWGDRIEVRGREGIALFDEGDAYSLGVVLDYFTASQRQRVQLDLPEFGAFPTSRQARNNRQAKRDMWSRPATIAGHIARVATFLRILELYGPAEFSDPAKVSLKDALAPENVLLLLKAEADELYSSYFLSRIAMTIGIIAAPCLEAIAWARGDEEGEEVASRMSEVCSMAYGNGYMKGRTAKNSLYQHFTIVHEEEAREEDSDPRPDQIETAWLEQFPKHDYAYTAMAVDVQPAAESEILNELGLRRWTEMDLELALNLKRKQMREIQGVGMSGEQGAVPLRAETLRQLHQDERHTLYIEGQERVAYSIPAKKLKSGEKSKKPRSLNVLVPQEHSEELMNVIKRFIRPLLLQKSPIRDSAGKWTGEWKDHPDYPDTGELWVADTAHPQVKSARMGEKTPNDRLRAVLDLAARVLDFDPDALWPFASSHPRRHMLGTYFVNKLQDAQSAADLLGHVDTTLVYRDYSAERKEVDAGAAYEGAARVAEQLMERRGASGHRLTPEEEIQLLQARQRELEAQLAAEQKPAA